MQTANLLPENLNETEYLQQQILDSLPVAVYTCDNNGYVKSYNSAAVKLWGRKPALGKDLWCGSWKIIDPRDESRIPLDSCPMAQALKTGARVRDVEIIVERPDGSRRYVLPHPDPIFDSEGKVTGAVNTLVDITETRLAEKLVQEKLEGQVAQRTRELQKVNHQLRRSNEDLEQFAYVASHDLQEPIRRVLTFTELLERNIEIPEKRSLFLKKINSAGKKMTLLVRGLLHYSRLSSVTDAAVPCDLNRMLLHVKKDLELRIREKGARIITGRLPTIEAVPLLLNQLFYNLMSNALKFSAEGRKPQISISSRELLPEELLAFPSLQPGVSHYEICVRDNGIGFEQEYAERLFSIFQRLHNQDHYEGSGIGLTICRNIVYRHHGTIYARSEKGRGASFYLILPATQPE